MSIAIYPSGRSLTLVRKDTSTTKTIKKTNLREVTAPTSYEFPGLRSSFITRENATHWGFASLVDAVDFLVGHEGAGQDFAYSLVLTENQWHKKPLYLMDNKEVVAEITERTMRKPDPMPEKSAKEALEFLRRVADQSVSRRQYLDAQTPPKEVKV